MCSSDLQAASLATERDDDLVVAGLAADAREAVGEDAAAEVGGELALDVAREAAAVWIRVAQLGEEGLRVARDQLVQHRPLGGAALVAAERLSGGAGRAFVEATREHARVRWKFRAGRSRPHVARLQHALSAYRTSGKARRHVFTEATPPLR